MIDRRPDSLCLRASVSAREAQAARRSRRHSLTEYGSDGTSVRSDQQSRRLVTRGTEPLANRGGIDGYTALLDFQSTDTTCLKSAAQLAHVKREDVLYGKGCYQRTIDRVIARQVRDMRIQCVQTETGCQFTG